MSLINPTLPTQGFSLHGGAIDLERSPGNALAQSLVPTRLGGDNLAPSSLGQQPGFGQNIRDGGFGGFGGYGGFGGQGGLGGILQALLGSLDSILQMLVGLFNSPQSGQFPTPGMPPQPQPQPLNETAFTHATASSVGDPHESFRGTNAGGTTANGTWDSMKSHANLLSSDSFAGGYRVSTTATTPDAKGVTYNASARVTTDGGNTHVAMNADGSYDVSAFGKNVSLETGAPVRLDANESVTLNADRSLTIDERDAKGATISTTLKNNGSGGVDVSNDASNVDLGGYLVTKNDSDRDPVGMAAPSYGIPTGLPSPSYPEPIAYAPSAYATSGSPFAGDAVFRSQPEDIEAA